MAYPDEIMQSLTSRYSLSVTEQGQLRETLLTAEIQTAVEAGQFDPGSLVLPLKVPEDIQFKVLSVEEAKQVLAHPELLTNQEAWLEWNRIKYSIEQLNQLRRGAVNERRQAAIEISKKLEISYLREYIRSNTVLLREYFDISPVLYQHINARYESVETAAAEYFKIYYVDLGKVITDISFRHKNDGVQLGRIMKVKYNDIDHQSHEIEYYIKTHQQGSLSDSRGRSAMHVDLKELLVYKILEYTGYGPKTHFFFNPLSLGGFFIATQDAGFTKIPGKKKRFDLFDRVVAQYEEIPAAPQHDSARQALIALDILSRILRITDTAPNPSNYGRVTVNEDRQKWKLLDFRIESEVPAEVLRRRDDPTHPCHLYFNDCIYYGFLLGNGAFNYEGRHFFKNIFKDPTTENRKFEMAKLIIEALREGKPCQSREARKMPLNDAITRAFEEIKTYAIQHNDKLHLELNAVLTDLRRYVVSIRLNFQLLDEGIVKRCQEQANLPSDSRHKPR